MFNEFTNKIKSLQEQTFNENIIINSTNAYKISQNQALISSISNINEKLNLAIKANKYDNIGKDLIIKCANDLICDFAEILFFSSNYTNLKIDTKITDEIFKNIALTCKDINCTLMDININQANNCDLTGFMVGMKQNLDEKNFIKNGDILLALPSNGLHFSGYSLAVKALFDILNMKFDDKINNDNLIDLLLTPTKIYINDILNLKPFISKCVQIGNGGLMKNLSKILPKGLGVNIKTHYLKIPEIFYKIGEVTKENLMYENFNMGVGIALIADIKNVSKILENSNAYIIGEIVINEGIVLE